MIILKILFASLLIGPLLWGILNWLRFRKYSRPQERVNIATPINSAVMYALAFNVIFFLQELFLVIGKKSLGLEAYMSHNDHNWSGDHPMATLMQGSGALAIFIIGLLCLGIFQVLRKSQGIWKLLFLWLAFQGLIQSIPQVAVAYFDPNTDVGQALVGYLQLGQPTLMILTFLSILSTALLSIWFSTPLLEFAPVSFNFDNPRAKFKYLGFIAFGAGLLGSLLVVPFRIPPLTQAITPFIVFAFSVPWVWASGTLNKQANPRSNRINDQIYWGPIALLVLLFIFFRLVLAPGINF